MLNEINTIFKMSQVLKILSLLRAALTVGIIGYTAFKIYAMMRGQSDNELA
ncbi:MAG: hypothetical protein J1F23_00740 [Oscillospiraceae bacterium]|nr:hypothetical protein [Oscillospiraceae bacterium]